MTIIIWKYIVVIVVIWKNEGIGKYILICNINTFVTCFCFVIIANFYKIRLFLNESKVNLKVLKLNYLN